MKLRKLNIYSPLAVASNSGNIPSVVISKLRSIYFVPPSYSNENLSPFSIAVTIYSYQ